MHVSKDDTGTLQLTAPDVKSQTQSAALEAGNLGQHSCSSFNLSSSHGCYQPYNKWLQSHPYALNPALVNICRQSLAQDVISTLQCCLVISAAAFLEPADCSRQDTLSLTCHSLFAAGG